MYISKEFLSHPNRRYIEHISNIAKSFNDIEHKIVAEYHDLGKLSNRFQEYISLKQREGERLKEFEKRRDRLKTTHTLESAYLYFSNADRDNINFLANFFAILKHHTSLPNIKRDMRDYLAIIDSYMDSGRLERIEDIAKKVNIKVCKDIYEFIDFFDELEDREFYQNLDEFFRFKERYSKLILADKFEAIFNRFYKNIDYLKDKKIDEYLKNIEDTISKKPKNRFRESVREEIFKNYKNSKESNIYIIKAPTGVGKTFIGLELALKISKRYRKRRVITAIPFTSIIDQTYQVYREILGDVLKYHHLTKYENSDRDELKPFGKEIFLSDIWHEHFIVTTFNQILYTLFSHHNRDNLRLETLRDSVIIIDEIQNIPRVLIDNVSKTFELFAKRYNIHFIIMSATLPSIKSILKESCQLSSDWFYKQKTNRYRLSFKSDIKSFEDLAENINSQRVSTICVVNTIEKAKILFGMVDGEERVDKFLLTTHQIPLHRQEIIIEIKEALNSGKAIKLISTQLIEAGVDLDFNIGYREFSPFGSIVQMAGRVNREGRNGVCDVFIFDFLNMDRLPYRAIDLQEEKILNWLETPIEEIEILENIDRYFEIVKSETTNINLIEKMKNLEFEDLKILLDENFMPNQPWKVSLFIEQRENHFKEFIEKREELLNSDIDKFEAISRVKELEKDLGEYTINISFKLIQELNRKYPISQMFGRYILPFGNPTYTKYRGFNLELSSFEESFNELFS